MYCEWITPLLFIRTGRSTPCRMEHLSLPYSSSIPEIGWKVAFDWRRTIFPFCVFDSPHPSTSAIDYRILLLSSVTILSTSSWTISHDFSPLNIRGRRRGTRFSQLFH